MTATKSKAICYDKLTELLADKTTEDVITLMCNNFNTDELTDFINFIKTEEGIDEEPSSEGEDND